MSKRLIFLTSFVLVLSMVSNTIGQPTGEILIEYWNNIGGTTMDDLYNSALFPDSPDEGEYLTSFDRPYDRPAPNNDNYGARARGFLYPPETGDYTFWVAADDDCDLFLSTDDDPVNKVLIAEINGWCDPYDWDNATGSDNPDQVSAPVALEAGVKYYIEGAYKEGGGGDGIAVAWQGPGIPDRVVIAGDYLSPAAISAVLLKAKNPNPADGAVDADTASLEWVGGQTSVSYKVYLSTDATIEESELVAETDLTIHLTALDIGAAYYWRVDAVEADGAVIEGNLWSFTTLPLEAHFPSPEDGAKSQPLDSKLGWTAGKGVIMHDVYFGTDEALVAASDPSTFKGKVMVTSYDPGALDLETTYYWKVDEFSVTGTNAGPLWSFTTFGSVEITDPDLLLYYDFEGGEGSVAIDQSGHSNHGTLVGDPQWATGVFGGGLDFDGDGDYVDGGNDTVFDITDGFTLSVWINWRATGATWQTVVAKGDNAWRLARGGDTQTMDFGFTAGGDRGWQAARTTSEVPLGEWHHVAATYDTIDGAKIYLDGVLEGENPDTGGITVGDYPVLVGENPQALNRFWDGLIDEVRVYSKTLTAVEILKLLGSVSDVTAPGDIVKGVPDETRDGSVAGWPDGEYPGLALDDDVSTKFLHFKGEVEPTGFVVEPALGASIVTGLTFTTANDAIERDPISYELSGSNESIDGPYELIASGDIVDFAQETALPRFTMNGTAIMFNNYVAYKYYQVMFPTVRDAASANSMQIAEVELLGVPISDVTAPGDVVLGVPNDGDWPGAETPDLAIDDDTGTKFLHFKGAIGTSGIQVTPLNGASIVTGLTFTTANDATERDPVAFELSGSNDSIDGPYELIASGDIVDFAQETAWPRFTMNATRISFDNDVAYSHYQVLFPAVRDAASANSMQIAEVELLGVTVPPLIILVSGNHDWDADGVVDDFALADLLMAEGYNVDYQPGNWIELDDAKIAALNAADLVIISRTTSSGDYANDADEIAQWNALTAPMLSSSTHLVRSSRWMWADSTSLLDNAPAVMELADGTQIEAMDGAVGLSSFIDAAPGNGTVLATGDGLPWIIEWEAGVEYYDGAGQTAGGPRVFFVAGTQEVEGGSNWGEWNLTPAGLEIYLDTVDRLLNPHAPTIAWVSYHGADDEPHADAAAVGFTQAPDIEYTDLLKAQGYNVVRVLTSGTPDVEFLNTMDLVIISRTASSGHYGGGGATLWNSITSPMINLNGYTLRSSRMGFTDGTDMPDTTGDIRLTVTDPAHPIFAGIALTDGTMDNLYAEGAVPLPTDGVTISRGISINNNNIDDEGTVLATIAEASADAGPVGGMVIAEWPAGATMENSSGSPTDVLGGPRLVFLTGSREPSGVTGGQAAALYDLYPDGEQMFLNAVEYMLP